MTERGRTLRKSDQGMTLIEVAFAITILLIGVGFIAKSNAVSFKFRDQSTEYKQMLFYAAGQMDAIIENQTVSESEYMPFNSYAVTSYPSEAVAGLGTYLEKVGVQVTAPGENSVVIYSYRLK